MINKWNKWNAKLNKPTPVEHYVKVDCKMENDGNIIRGIEAGEFDWHDMGDNVIAWRYST